MRVLLSIDSSSTVTCADPALPVRRLVAAADGAGGLVPLVDYGHHADEQAAGLMAQGAAAIYGLYERMMRRVISAGDPEAFGQYLADCLLGPNWAAIRAAAAARNEWFIELALSCDPQDVALSRLPWELMRGSADYISNGYVRDNRRVYVAITRVVPKAASTPHQIEGLPRVLFAVGTSLLDSSVRPAAEILCMLKRTREQQRRMHPRMLERATPSALEAAVRTFRPDVVHLICHGGITAGVPFLRLQSETGSGDEAFTAAQIAPKLQPDGQTPPIVLLSACQSGTAMMGPQGVGPFAAQLVQFGVPIVIGMSGKVSDIACRLFTRRFAESLMGADRLIEATAEGRRAAFAEGKAPEKSIDWAFPAVFLSEGVKPEYQPTDATAPPDPCESRIRAYNVRSVPAFCGRQNFFQEFDALFRPGGPSVLAIYTPDGTPGYGRKRLLEELAVQAILDRNVPVLVSSRTWKDSQQPPTTPLKLALEIDRAVDTAGRAFGVKLAALSPAKRLQQLIDNNFNPAVVADFDEEMQAALIGSAGTVPPEAALLAIERRLTELMTRIRAEYQRLRDEAVAAATGLPAGYALSRAAEQAQAELAAIAQGRVVLMLDSVHLCDAALKALLSCPSLGDTGAGTKVNPVPVVVTFSLKSTASTILDPMVQNQTAYPGWRFLPLNAFEANGENLLAYARVLLSPFDPGILPNFSGKAWVMDDSVPPQVREKHVNYFNTLLRGLPAEFSDRLFFALAMVAEGDQFLKPAADDDYLANLEAERQHLPGGRP